MAKIDRRKTRPIDPEHMSRLGKIGGKRGGPERARRLSPERRSEIARMGGHAKAKRVGTFFDDQGMFIPDEA